MGINFFQGIIRHMGADVDVVGNQEIGGGVAAIYEHRCRVFCLMVVVIVSVRCVLNNKFCSPGCHCVVCLQSFCWSESSVLVLV